MNRLMGRSIAVTKAGPAHSRLSRSTNDQGRVPATGKPTPSMRNLFGPDSQQALSLRRPGGRA
jgi:hypothetical protein